MIIIEDILIQTCIQGREGGMVYDVLIWKKNVQNERLQRTNCEIF